jgi:hypothetical protein
LASLASTFAIADAYLEHRRDGGLDDRPELRPDPA